MFGVEQAIASRRQLLPLAISSALFLAALLALAQSYLQLTRSGYPYEGWDEIATSNNAVVFDSPVRHRVYAYGSLDTFFHVVAQFSFDRLTPTGKTTLRHSYSNNVLPSLENPLLVHGDKTWAGTDYGYFRGLNYRDSIFIARELYVYAVLALCCVLAGLSICFFGTLAPPLLFCTLFLLTTPLFVGQARQALPNAVSCLLTTTIFLTALAGVLQARPRLFVIAAVLFPLALNMKIDVAMLGLFLAASYAAALFLAGATLRSSAALSGKLLAIFLAVFIASRPGLLFDPAAEWAIQRDTLAALSVGKRDWGLNLSVFLKGLDDSCGLGIATTVMILFFTLLAMQEGLSTARKRLVAALTLLALAILWAGPILTAVNPYPRYFLNGAGVFSVVAGFTIVLGLSQKRLAARGIALLLLVALCGVSLVRLLQIREDGSTLAQALAGTQGLDPKHTRNRASLEMVRLIRQGKYAPEVLVDQHSYTDLGVFARNGIKATYLNVYNYQDILRELSRPTLVLYVTATGYQANDPRWNRNTRWSKRTVDWAGYTAALESLPRLLEIKGTVMDSLSIAPVMPTDGVVVAEVGTAKGSSPPSQPPR